MPKFVIERQYLLPIYQRLIIDAPDITTACQEAVENDDWESAEEDGDGSGATTISAAREIPEGLIEQIERGNIHAGSFLWEDSPNMGRGSRSPRNSLKTNNPPTPLRQQLRGLAASEPSGHPDSAENLSKNRLAVRGAAYVGNLSDERGSPSGPV